MANYQVGDIAYFIESNRYIREGKLLRRTGDQFLFRFLEGGGIQIPVSRLYPTEEAAQAALDILRRPSRKLLPKRDPRKTLAFFL